MAGIRTTVKVAKNNQPVAQQQSALENLPYFADGSLEILGLSYPWTALVVTENAEDFDVKMTWTYPQATFQSQFPTLVAKRSALAGQLSGQLSGKLPVVVLDETIEAV